MTINQTDIDKLKKEQEVLSTSINNYKLEIETVQKELKEAKKELEEVNSSLETGKNALLELGEAKSKADKARKTAEEKQKEAEDKLKELVNKIEKNKILELEVFTSIENKKIELVNLQKGFDDSMATKFDEIAKKCDKIKQLL